MGVKVYTVSNDMGLDLAEIGSVLAEWLLQTHNFSIDKKAWGEDDSFFVHAKKSGVLRQISGLVFMYKIKISAAGDSSVVLAIDYGDIRKQLASLGVSFFVFAPVLVTSGIAMFTSGGFCEKIKDRVERMLSEKSCEESCSFSSNSSRKVSGVVRDAAYSDGIYSSSTSAVVPKVALSGDVGKYYEILGCSSSDSNEVISQKYGELISMYHGDNLNDLPEDFLVFARGKAEKINEAYDMIRRHRRSDS